MDHSFDKKCILIDKFVFLDDNCFKNDILCCKKTYFFNCIIN